MEEQDAEKMKLKYGCAYTDNNDIDNNMKYSIDADRQVESRKFIEIVEGRLEEIIENVWYQIPNDYYDKLLGGIILTGGGSNMKDIEKAFRNHTHIEKIRIAKFVTQTITSNIAEINAKNGTMNTVLGLLAKGDINCAGNAIDPNGDLFAIRQTGTVSPAEPRKVRQATETDPGVIRTEREKQLAEEEARRKKDEEDRIARQRAEEEAREAARIKKENSFWNKAFKGIKKFGSKMIEEEE
jgi:cell division protein FtsA